MPVADSSPNAVGQHSVPHNVSLEEQHSDILTNPFSSSYNQWPKTGELQNPQSLSSTQNTNPFPAGYVESHAAALRHQRGLDQKDIPISHLDTTTLSYRILVQPSQTEGFRIPNADQFPLYPSADKKHLSKITVDGSYVKCFAVHEVADTPCCKIHTGTQWHEIFFAPSEDSVSILNRGTGPTHISPLGEEDKTETIVIMPLKNRTITTGAWVITNENNDTLFQMIIFPRRYSLIVSSPHLQQTAGQKRRFSDRKKPIKKLERQVEQRNAQGLHELVDKESVNISGNKMSTAEEYCISRVKLVAATQAATVFQASHSSYEGKLIVVKALKKHPKSSSINRGWSWINEYNLHSELQHQNIVRMLGGDARLHAFFLDYFEGKDLAHPHWCDRRQGCMFTGSRMDMKHIFRAVTSVLEYLYGKKVKHNDLKPSNILYDGSKVLVIDFGLATLHSGLVCNGGTPWYIPPEYLLKHERGVPADVWSLGIIQLYLMCRLALPDSGKDVKSWLIKEIEPSATAGKASANAQMSLWLDLIRQKTEELAKEIDDEIDDDGMKTITVRMLAITPNKRPQPQELANFGQNLPHDGVQSTSSPGYLTVHSPTPIVT
ncbi:kinase-like domain-containing protein [Xylariales sp. PMI_506]|nr:kinase-like domain-containing protein [Xylariales sp. PMI_506]